MRAAHTSDRSYRQRFTAIGHITPQEAKGPVILDSRGDYQDRSER
jgi:hypothetical protein